MRGIMLLSLITMAVSAPQGFNYAEMQHQPHLEYGPVATPITTLDVLKNLQALMAVQTANIDTGESYDSNLIEQYATTLQQPTQQQYLTTSNFAENSLKTSDESSSNYYAQQMPIISKRFFLHSAPEDDEDTEVQQKHITVGKPRKNFNIVFIKAPAKSAKLTSLKISPAVNEERTVIYVLAKKQDVADIDTHVLEPATTTARPEVYFIKYKTPEEAEHVQHAIQSQYDALGGSTLISNEGVASASSVIGSLDERKDAVNNEFINVKHYQSQQAQLEDVTSTNNGYLPPNFRKY